MRVMYWAEQFWPHIGGVEVYGAMLLRELGARGHEVSVVTSPGTLDLPAEATHDGVQIFRFPFHQALAEKDVRLIVRLRTQISALKRSFAADLHVVNVTGAQVLFHLETEAADAAPTLLALHRSMPREAPPESLLWRAASKARRVTTLSEAMCADLLRTMPELADRVVVVPSGYPPPPLAEPLPPLVLSPPTLVCVGRVVREKGFDLVLDALPSLVARFPGLRLVVAGDGPERAALEGQASALEVRSHVDFVGWVDPARVPDLLARATVVVVPSRVDEAFGLVALQAAQLGRPVVTTPRGGLPEIVAHGASGLVAADATAAAIGAAVATLLSDEALCRRLGAGGAHRARTAFAWDTHVDRVVALWQDVGADLQPSVSSSAPIAAGTVSGRPSSS